MVLMKEATQPGMAVSYVAHRHRIPPSPIFAWRRRMSEGGKESRRPQWRASAPLSKYEAYSLFTAGIALPADVANKVVLYTYCLCTFGTDND